MQLVRYYPYFIIGVFLRKYNKIDLVFGNQFLFTLSLSLSLIIIYCNLQGIHFLGRTFILPIALVNVLMFVLKQSEASNNCLNRLLSFLGSKTMDIYLFHYFVLGSFPMAFMSDFLVDAGFYLQFFVLAPVALIISFISVAIGYIIRSSRIFSQSIFYN